MSSKPNLLTQITAALKNRSILDKIFFSLIILVLFRFLIAIPVVGIPADALKNLFAGTNFSGILSSVTGSALETASVVALGVGPYINASIILQLLTPIVPRLEELRKEGTNGQRTISMITRYLSVPLAFIQCFAIYSILKGTFIDEVSTLELVAMCLTFTAGAVVMMWCGELIAESGYGKGTGYIIAIGILAYLPAQLRENLQVADPLQIAIFVASAVILVALTILVVEAERKVKVLYSRRVRQGTAQESFIPLKLTQFGVMPVIFASALVAFPQLIAQFLLNADVDSKIKAYSQQVVDIVNNQWFFNITTFILVIFFSFFYVTVIFNTKEIAENLQKQGAFIPGVRPGASTAKYLQNISFRLTAFGSVFLGLLAVLPNVFVATGLLTSAVVSGTGILIVIGVLLDVRRQIKSEVVSNSYDRYL